MDVARIITEKMTRSLSAIQIGQASALKSVLVGYNISLVITSYL